QREKSASHYRSPIDSLAGVRCLANVEKGGFMTRLVAMMTVLLVAAASAAAVSAGNGTPINPGSENALTLAVYGDSPYGTAVGDQTQVNATPAFIETINADPKV